LVVLGRALRPERLKLVVDSIYLSSDRVGGALPENQYIGLERSPHHVSQ